MSIMEQVVAVIDSGPDISSTLSTARCLSSRCRVTGPGLVHQVNFFKGGTM